MAYAVIADVQALNSHRDDYGASTQPTQTEVESFITDISAEIDTVLSAKGVFTPVATPASFLTWLKRLNAYGAAGLAEMSAFPEYDRGQASSPQGDRYWALYQQGLKALKDGSAIHRDAPTVAAGRIFAATYGTDNPDPATGAAPAPVFSMDTVF